MLISGYDIGHGERLQAGLVVIGAGPAGIVCALEAAKHGTDVVLIETGNRKRRSGTQSLVSSASTSSRFTCSRGAYGQSPNSAALRRSGAAGASRMTQLTLSSERLRLIRFGRSAMTIFMVTSRMPVIGWPAVERFSTPES